VRPAEGRWGILWVAAGASLWGTDTMLRRPLAGSLSSVQIVWLEHLILTAVLWPVLVRSRREWQELGVREWAAAAFIAWGGSAAATAMFTEAIRTGNPTTAVLLQKTQPLFTALLAGAVLGERLGRTFWICFALAVGGGYLVSFGWALATPQSAAAAAWALGAAALWGSCTVLGRFVLRSISFSTLTAWRIVLAAPVLTAAAWGPVRVDGPQGGRLLAMALVPGLAALLVYYHGLRQTPASRAAIAELSFPATAGLLNWVVLGVGVTAAQVAGFALLWGVIFYLQRQRR
jgi:drug/metabolite transporter (DMT)-like permease